MNRLGLWWEAIRTSLWFVPAMLIGCAVALAIGLVELDTRLDRDQLEQFWPLLFGTGPSASRDMLAAIATSMITVASIVFSITTVTLAQASSQYTSRILRTFMRDRATQVVLGVFVSIFAYCMIVLRTIRGSGEDAFVPSVAVLVALVLAFVGIGSLIYFIHHVALSIQAESIIRSTALETLGAVERLFPETAETAPPQPLAATLVELGTATAWMPVPALYTGYLQNMDFEHLLDLAAEQHVVVRMERGIGEFSIAGTPIISVLGGPAPDDRAVTAWNAFYTVGFQRTMVQDVGFGIRQIVDVALKALSPGVNDTTTAVISVNYLGAILSKLVVRPVDTPALSKDGEVRIIFRGPTFASLLADAFDQIRQSAGGNVHVLRRQMEVLEELSELAETSERKQTIAHHMDLITEATRRTVPVKCDQQQILNVRQHDSSRGNALSSD